jgi:hypothetical protein
MRSKEGFMRPMLLAAVALALAVPAIGCGESSDSAASQSQEDNAQDTARAKLEQCLRENGVDVPSGEGQGIGQLSDAEREKFQEAIDGPCADLRQDVIGDISPEQQQEFQDALTRFRDCMRDHGIEVPSGAPGEGGGGAAQLDRDDPDVQEAMEQCQDNLPERFGPRGG